MGDMSRRPGSVDGPDDHLAGARHPGVRGDGLPASGDLTGDSDDLTDALAGSDPRLAAFLDRSTEVLRTGPDEVTARRHLSMLRREAAVVSPRGRGLRVVSIAAAAAVAAVVTLAGFGTLPAPAQQVLSDVADRVGINLPSPAEARQPSFEVPTKQRPDPETVPGRPGGPDRSELPGLDDGVLQTPGESDGMTPGERSGEPPAPEQDRSEEAPADERIPEQPPALDPPDGQSGSPPDDEAEDLPDSPEEPPSAPETPDPPAGEDPPAAEQGSDLSEGQQDAPSQPSGR